MIFGAMKRMVVERMGGNGNAMQCRGNGDGDASRCSLR